MESYEEINFEFVLLGYIKKFLIIIKLVMSNERLICICSNNFRHLYDLKISLLVQIKITHLHSYYLRNDRIVIT